MYSIKRVFLGLAIAVFALNNCVYGASTPVKRDPFATVNSVVSPDVLVKKIIEISKLSNAAPTVQGFEQEIKNVHEELQVLLKNVKLADRSALIKYYTAVFDATVFLIAYIGIAKQQSVHFWLMLPRLDGLLEKIASAEKALSLETKYVINKIDTRIATSKSIGGVPSNSSLTDIVTIVRNRAFAAQCFRRRYEVMTILEYSLFEELGSYGPKDKHAASFGFNSFINIFKSMFNAIGPMHSVINFSTAYIISHNASIGSYILAVQGINGLEQFNDLLPKILSTDRFVNRIGAIRNAINDSNSISMLERDDIEKKLFSAEVLVRLEDTLSHLLLLFGSIDSSLEQVYDKEFGEFFLHGYPVIGYLSALFSVLTGETDDDKQMLLKYQKKTDRLLTCLRAKHDSFGKKSIKALLEDYDFWGCNISPERNLFDQLKTEALAPFVAAIIKRQEQNSVDAKKKKKELVFLNNKNNSLHLIAGLYYKIGGGMLPRWFGDPTKVLYSDAYFFKGLSASLIVQGLLFPQPSLFAYDEAYMCIDMTKKLEMGKSRLEIIKNIWHALEKEQRPLDSSLDPIKSVSWEVLLMGLQTHKKSKCNPFFFSSGEDLPDHIAARIDPTGKMLKKSYVFLCPGMIVVNADIKLNSENTHVTETSLEALPVLDASSVLNVVTTVTPPQQLQRGLFFIIVQPDGAKSYQFKDYGFAQYNALFSNITKTKSGTVTGEFDQLGDLHKTELLLIKQYASLIKNLEKDDANNVTAYVTKYFRLHLLLAAYEKLRTEKDFSAQKNLFVGAILKESTALQKLRPALSSQAIKLVDVFEKDGEKLLGYSVSSLLTLTAFRVGLHRAWMRKIGLMKQLEERFIKSGDILKTEKDTDTTMPLVDVYQSLFVSIAKQQFIPENQALVALAPKIFTSQKKWHDFLHTATVSRYEKVLEKASKNIPEDQLKDVNTKLAELQVLDRDIKEGAAICKKFSGQEFADHFAIHLPEFILQHRAFFADPLFVQMLSNQSGADPVPFISSCLPAIMTTYSLCEDAQLLFNKEPCVKKVLYGASHIWKGVIEDCTDDVVPLSASRNWMERDGMRAKAIEPFLNACITEPKKWSREDGPLPWVTPVTDQMAKVFLPGTGTKK